MPDLWCEYGKIAEHFIERERKAYPREAAHRTGGPDAAARCWLARNRRADVNRVDGFGVLMGGPDDRQEKNNRGIEIEAEIIAHIVAEATATPPRLTVEGVDAHGDVKRLSPADFRIAGLAFDFNGNRVMRGDAPPIEGAKVVVSEAEPTEMPRRDPSTKQKVHDAAVEILDSGAIAQGRRSKAALAEEVQKQFPNYPLDTLARYSSAAHAAWRKRPKKRD